MVVTILKAVVKIVFLAVPNKISDCLETDGAHARSIVNMFDCLILSYILKTFIQRKLRLLIILVILPEKITNST